MTLSTTPTASAHHTPPHPFSGDAIKTDEYALSTSATILDTDPLTSHPPNSTPYSPPCWLGNCCSYHRHLRHLRQRRKERIIKELRKKEIRKKGKTSILPPPPPRLHHGDPAGIPLSRVWTRTLGAFNAFSHYLCGDLRLNLQAPTPTKSVLHYVFTVPRTPKLHTRAHNPHHHHEHSGTKKETPLKTPPTKPSKKQKRLLAHRIRFELTQIPRALSPNDFNIRLEVSVPLDLIQRLSLREREIGRVTDVTELEVEGVDRVRMEERIDSEVIPVWAARGWRALEGVSIAVEEFLKIVGEILGRGVERTREERAGSVGSEASAFTVESTMVEFEDHGEDVEVHECEPINDTTANEATFYYSSESDDDDDSILYLPSPRIEEIIKVALESNSDTSSTHSICSSSHHTISTTTDATTHSHLDLPKSLHHDEIAVDEWSLRELQRRRSEGDGITSSTAATPRDINDVVDDFIILPSCSYTHVSEQDAHQHELYTPICRVCSTPFPCFTALATHLRASRHFLSSPTALEITAANPYRESATQTAETGMETTTGQELKREKMYTSLVDPYIPKPGPITFEGIKNRAQALSPFSASRDTPIPPATASSASSSSSSAVSAVSSSALSHATLIIPVTDTSTTTTAATAAAATTLKKAGWIHKRIASLPGKEKEKILSATLNTTLKTTLGATLGMGKEKAGEKEEKERTLRKRRSSVAMKGMGKGLLRGLTRRGE
ncbi:hypothetical protein EX30DRAFT_397945 [Ascodesmis nigricans]|uniref:C2H2-type domain-containing protein n=1 Tax=Ascodesmis nigricans TaxID=341454 RepID=A0A4V3SI11_9PEZI|nr:hypothetical protein EX30DRAFT_397945 [Ascodesmis nigricans]